MNTIQLIAFKIFKWISLSTFFGFICVAAFLDNKKCYKFADKHKFLFILFIALILFGMTFFIVDFSTIRGAK